MARNRARLSKAITLNMVGRSFMPWAPGAYAAFDFQNDRAIWTRQNILEYSQDFSNAVWINASMTDVAGITAPDGTTSRLFYDTSSAGRFYQAGFGGPLAANYTLSIWAKAQNKSWLCVRKPNNAAEGAVWFNLGAGTVGTVASGYAATIQSEGDGWYRCVVSWTSAVSFSSVSPSVADADNTVATTPNGTDGIYIWRAQLEAGSEATAYILTTAAATNGAPERLRNLAATPNWTFTRASTGYALDLAGNLVSFASGALRRTDRGVLIEGARQNICLQSQTFQTTWSRVNLDAFGSGSVTDAIAAPDGTTTADFIRPTTGNGQHRLDQSITISSGTAYTVSCYAKEGGYNFLWLRLTDGVGTPCGAIINLTTGAVTTSAGTVSAEQLANGWWRLSITGTTAGTAGTVRINATNNTSFGDFAGDGTSGIYIWGAQLEAASFASSYIPTTTASVTRAADALSITGVSGITYPLTGFAEFERLTDTATTEFLFQIDAGGSTDRVVVSVETTDRFDVAVTAGGAGQGNSSPTETIAAGSAARRGAFRVNTNSIRACLGGTLGTEDTSVTLPAQPSAIRIGSNHSAAGQPFNYLRRIAIWTSAFTDAQLQTQTT